MIDGALGAANAANAASARGEASWRRARPETRPKPGIERPGRALRGASKDPRLKSMASKARALSAAAVSLMGGAAVSWASACGLPHTGLSDRPLDGGANDATSSGRGGDSASPPENDTGAGDGGTGLADAAGPACEPVDAACLGSIPPGWAPVQVSDGGCAPGFGVQTLQVNPRLRDGGCACGACAVVGSFTCNGVVPISGGDGCNDPTLVTATSGTCAVASAQHVEAHPPQATGTVACSAPNDVGAGATSDPLTLCIPACGVDYCQGSARCIEADGERACPAGFALRATAGTGVDPGCAPCPCEAGAPGACRGTVTAYDNATCADSGTQTTYAMGTCNQYSTTNDYQSLLVELVPPLPTCSSPTADVGDASLTGVKTICCQ